MHKVEHFFFFDIETESTHGYFELMVIDSPCFISIKEVKSFFDFLFLLLSQLLSLSSLTFARYHLSSVVRLLSSQIIRFFVHFFSFNSLNFKIKKLNKKKKNCFEIILLNLILKIRDRIYIVHTLIELTWSSGRDGCLWCGRILLCVQQRHQPMSWNGWGRQLWPQH